MDPADVSSVHSFDSLSFQNYSETYHFVEIDYVSHIYGCQDFSRPLVDDGAENVPMLYSETRLLKLLLLHWTDLAHRHSDIERLTSEEYGELYLDSFQCSDNLWEFLQIEFIRLQSLKNRNQAGRLLPALPNRRAHSLAMTTSEPALSGLAGDPSGARRRFSGGVPRATAPPGDSCHGHRHVSSSAVGGARVEPDQVALKFVTFISSIHDNLALHLLSEGPSSIPTPFRGVFRALIQVQCTNHGHLMSILFQIKKHDSLRLFEFEGAWQPDVTCEVCFESEGALLHRCSCDMVVCEPCFTQYINTQVTGLSRLHIECPASHCHHLIRYPTIWLRLTEKNRKIYEKIRNSQIQSDVRKLCPNCMIFYELSNEEKGLLSSRKYRKLYKKGFNVKCGICQWEWCYKCQSGVHEVTCKKNMSTDKLLMKWADSPAGSVQASVRKARKCPKCRILVERNGGCKHMECAKCKCSWCFDCGRRRLKVKHIPFMHHESKLFIFGCSKIFLANNSHLRRFVRVGVFCGVTVLIIPASAIAGVVLVALGVLLGLPFGCYMLALKLRKLSRPDD